MHDMPVPGWCGIQARTVLRCVGVSHTLLCRCLSSHLRCAVGADVPATDWRWRVQHALFPGMRGMFAPPSEMARNGAIVEVADLHKLYKIFERC